MQATYAAERRDFKHMTKRIVVALLLILLPLFDSLFMGNVFGLNWHSPALMYKVSVYLIPVKLLFAVIGLLLLYRSTVAGWLNYVKITVMVLGVLHACMLAVVCLLYLALGDKSRFYSSNGDIQLYTADTGAIGKSYHYFSYLCRGKYGFYTLIPISREDWLGQFSFKQYDGQLVITQHEDSDAKTIVREIPRDSCGT